MNDHDYMLLKQSLSSALARLRRARESVDARAIGDIETGLHELTAIEPNREIIATAMLLAITALQLLTPDDDLARTLQDQARMLFGIARDRPA